MNKTVKWILIIAGILFLIGFFGMRIMKHNTKKHSPEDTLVYTENGLDIEVFYNRPYKKGRDIFGGLVPYNETWRTGANEQTTFTTQTPLMVSGSHLDAGEYSLFTVPKESSWEIVFNNKAYSWGADWQTGKAPRLEKFDELIVEAPVTKTYLPIEQFTIDFKNAGDSVVMLLSWDDVVVSVPMKKM